jgi:hypothetical protein
VSRAVLAIGAACWGLAAAGALGLTIVGVDRLLTLLPPLAIDAEAVGGAVTAVGVALGIGAAVHVAILLGLRAGARLAWTGAVLTCAVAVGGFVALAAAAFASAAAEPSAVGALLAGGVVALVVALAYGAAAVGFIREIRAGRARAGATWPT